MKTLTISLYLLISSSLWATDTITVAVPDFVNATKGQTTRIAPGEYTEKNVKVGESSRTEQFKEDGKSVQTRERKDEYEKQLERIVEYAPGEWVLPEKAGTVAADALAGRLIEGKLKVLSRNTQTLKTREEERLYSTVSASPDELIDLYRDLNADYVIIGRIANFRIDETKGSAYGINLRRFETSVSGDIQVVDVATGEIAAQRQFNEVVSQNLPDGMSTTALYSWEAPLRTAIERITPALLSQILRDETSASGKAKEILVDIKSDPSGADILVGDLFVGNTPSKIPLEKGRSELKIEKQGYKPWSRTVKVHDTLKIDITLTELPEAPEIQKPEGE